MVVYFDDIIVLSDNMDVHKRHLAQLFEALRQHQMNMKKSKCMFAQSEILFLGHWVG